MFRTLCQPYSPILGNGKLTVRRCHPDKAMFDNNQLMTDMAVQWLTHPCFVMLFNNA